MTMLLAGILVVLHIVDGTPVIINSDQITTLRSPSVVPEHTHKLVTKDAKCQVNLADGKFVSVQEDCPTVQRMIDGK